MGKKSRKTKKEKEFKTKEMRDTEIENIKKQIEELGLSSQIDSIQTFYTYLDEFSNTGECNSGKIKLDGFKRILNYILTNTVGKKCLVNLGYDENI